MQVANTVGGSVGGSHSPHAALTAAGLSMEERQAIVDRIVALPAAHREAALAAIPSEINSDIRALVRRATVCHSPYPVSWT